MPATLERRLGVFSATTLIVGSMIGSGVFIAPSISQGACRPSGVSATTNVVFFPWLRGTEPVARWSCGAQP